MRLSYSDSDGNGVISNTEDFRDDFETRSRWTPDANATGSFSYDNTGASSGEWCAKIVNTAATEKYVHSDHVMNINNTGNVTYTYSVRVKGAPGSSGAYPVAEVVLFMKTANETGYFTQVSNKLVTTTGGWVTLSNTVTVPANIKTLSIRIDNNGGGTIWYDDAVIRRVTAPASEIVEESNYYPFGMKQEGYNNIVQTTRNIPAQRYKYQGQERQDELGLNWDSFKWRNYDFALGRFMSIDPLTEKYNTWSPYTFSGNRVIDARELEGLEPHLLHDSQDKAAENFASEYNGYSIENHIEVATQYYKINTTNGFKYSYTSPVQGGAGMVNPKGANDFPKNSVFVGDSHTHGEDYNINILINKVTDARITNPKGKGLNLQNIGDYNISNGSNAPSIDDLDWFKDTSKSPNFEASYLFTPSGLTYKSVIKNGKINTSIDKNLSKKTPSDEKSSLRMNNIKGKTNPKVLPKQQQLMKE